MADQLVPFLTGAYDHPVVQTPHLDALVAGGVEADAAYTPYPLVADPGEWRNLAGQPAMQEVKVALHGCIVAQFDPVRIAAAGAASVARGEVIKAAPERNGTHWDHAPQFHATRQYVR